jgi:HlyD family secretion protein
MYAVAEVYETDVGKLQVGQRASIVSEHGGFAGTLHGKVEHIGLQIKKQDVLASDPAADKDARVVEVKVRLDPQDTPKVAGLTNLQVRITFDLDSKYVGINKAN